MKCNFCNGSGQEKIYDPLTNAYLLIKCAYCNGRGELPQTEQEYIQSCNTEELAELLCDVWHGIDDVINIMAEDGKISKKDAVKIWLKKPHTNKETVRTCINCKRGE